MDGIKVPYTPKQMMEAAQFYERNEERVRRVVLSNNVLANIHETIPMLKYAAEVIERCYVERAIYKEGGSACDQNKEWCDSHVKLIDRILHAETGAA